MPPPAVEGAMTLGPRCFPFVFWSLVVCPVVGLVAALATHGNGDVSTFVLRFCVLPAVLVIAAGFLNRRRPGVIAGLAVTAALLGLVAWFVLIALAAASGVYD